MRSRALSISAVVLTATVVGGLTATTAAAAAAAPAANKATTSTATAHKADPDFAGLAKAARAHGESRQQYRHAQLKAEGAADDPQSCFTRYPDNPAQPENSIRIAERMSGADRYEVGVCVSNVTWADYTDPDADPSWIADAVVLARGDIYPDALAGGPLAAQVEGPLMLTKSTTLLPQVKAEIQRVLAPGGKVYLLGSTASVSSGVENTIRSLGYTPTRISGKDRYEVAVNIAKAMPATNLFFIANGLDFPDALSAGTTAAGFTAGARYSENPDDTPWAMLFTKGSTMPAASRDFAVERLNDFQGYWGLYPAGRAGYQATVGAFGSENVKKSFVGADRYQVATMIAQYFYVDPTTHVLSNWGFGLANGLNFPDALTGSSLFAELGSPLLLTSPTKLSPYTKSFLAANASGAPVTPAYIDVIGGPSSVSDSVMLAARSAFTPAA